MKFFQIGIMLFLLLRIPVTALRVRFLNVGHGDACQLQTPGGKQLLIDSGPPEKDFRLHHSIGRRIDLLILTHAHLDHSGNMLRLFRSCSIARFLEPGYPTKSPYYRKLLTAAHRKGTRITMPVRGNRLRIERNLSLLFLNPPRKLYRYTESDCNNNSLIFLLQYHRWKILFTGDAEQSAIKDVLRRFPGLRFQFLKIPHHGSRTGFSAALYQNRGIKAALLSSGRAKNRGNPLFPLITAACQRNRIRLLRTDRLGNITFLLNRQSAQIISAMPGAETFTTKIH